MAEKIYNAEYVAADPDFVDARPHQFAGILQNIIGPVKGAALGLWRRQRFARKSDA
jgi:hypothetical protein